MSTLKWAKCGSEKQCNIKQGKHKEGNENKEKTGRHLRATALIIATHIYLKPLWAPAFISEFSAAKFSTLLSCTCDISQSSSQVLLLCEVDKHCDDVSVGTSLTLFCFQKMKIEKKTNCAGHTQWLWKSVTESGTTTDYNGPFDITWKPELLEKNREEWNTIVF